MAITFPRLLPYEAFSSSLFKLRAVTTSNSLYGGKSHVQVVGPSLWTWNATTALLSGVQFRVWEAWFDSLRGGARTFLAHKPGQEYPRSYTTFSGLVRHGTATAFDGTGAATELAANEIAINTLPSTFAVKAGDLVGLVEDGVYGLFRIVEDTTAVAGALTATVEPQVNTSLFSTSATVNFLKPKAEFILASDDVDTTETANPTEISFSAVQRIY